MICTKCKQAVAEWHFQDMHYCRECWESCCSEEGWEFNWNFTPVDGIEI